MSDLDALSPEPLAFVDTETLGLDADVHPIWEVALIVDDVEHCWQIRLTARAISLANADALEITHFWDRFDPAKALAPDEVCRRVRDLTLGRHLVGAIPSFDEERLRRLMWANGQTPGWHYHLVDVEALVVGCLAERARWLSAGPGSLPGQGRVIAGLTTPPWRSEDISRLLGVEPEGYAKHTALGDARWARDLYHAVMAGRPSEAPEGSPKPAEAPDGPIMPTQTMAWMREPPSARLESPGSADR